MVKICPADVNYSSFNGSKLSQMPTCASEMVQWTSGDQKGDMVSFLSCSSGSSKRAFPHELGLTNAATQKQVANSQRLRCESTYDHPANAADSC